MEEVRFVLLLFEGRREGGWGLFPLVLQIKKLLISTTKIWNKQNWILTFWNVCQEIDNILLLFLLNFHFHSKRIDFDQVLKMFSESLVQLFEVVLEGFFVLIIRKEC